MSLCRCRESGGYTVYITPHGDKNYTNELRALPDKWKAGNFDLFFRIYMEGTKHRQTSRQAGDVSWKRSPSSLPKDG